MAPSTWVVNKYGEIQCYCLASEERVNISKNNKYQFWYKSGQNGNMIINNVILGIPGDRSILIDENGDVWITKYGDINIREIDKIGTI